MEKKLPFEKLRVWSDSLELTGKVYELTSKPEVAKDLSLADQLQRAVVSIGANIAEGAGRVSPKEYVRFLSIARGSCDEVLALIHIAQRIGYISESEHKELGEFAYCIHAKLSRLMASINKDFTG